MTQKICEGACKATLDFSFFNRGGNLVKGAAHGEASKEPTYYTTKCKKCIDYSRELNKQDILAEYKTCTKCYTERVCIEFSQETTPLVCYYCLSEAARNYYKKPVRYNRHKDYYSNPEVAQAKKEWMKKYMREQATNLTDMYIKIMINGSHKIPFKEITQEMIVLKRVTLFAKRALVAKRLAEDIYMGLPLDKQFEMEVLNNSSPSYETKHNTQPKAL